MAWTIYHGHSGLRHPIRHKYKATPIEATFFALNCLIIERRNLVTNLKAKYSILISLQR